MGPTKTEKANLPTTLVELVHQKKLDVMTIKCSNLFVRSVCSAMSFYNPNWERMLSDGRCVDSPRFKWIHKYVKDTLKDKPAFKIQVDAIEESLAPMMHIDKSSPALSFSESD